MAFLTGAVRRTLNPIAKAVGGVQARVAALADESTVVLDLERHLQKNGHFCGPTAALAILHFHGKGRSQDATARALGTDEDGTSTAPILRLFRARGLRPVIKARATLGDLRAGIDAGAPALVSVNHENHWSVVYGYSRHRIWLADPSAFQSLVRQAIPTAEFRARWDRWAMIVGTRPPARRPAAAAAGRAATR